MTAKKIEDIEHVSLAVPALAGLVDASLAVAAQAQGVQVEAAVGTVALQTGVSNLAFNAALIAANAIMAMAGGTCTLGEEPADMQVYGSSEGLEYRCGHKPPHRYDYKTGDLKP